MKKRSPISNLQSPKSGQTLIFMTMVVVMIAFAALFYFDVHKVLHVKAVSRNAGDAAALAGARWQAISLNLTGSLNLAQAQAHIDSLSRGESHSPEADLIADLRERITISGPMYGYISAQQAAKKNGLFNQQDFTNDLVNLADDYRVMGELGIGPRFNPSSGYGSAGDEVAAMLELAADHGAAVNVSLQYTIPTNSHLLLNPGFYDAIAGRSWCWFFHNAFDELQNYNHYTDWDDPGNISSYFDYTNSPYLSLWVRRMRVRGSIPVLPAGTTWRNTLERLRSELDLLDLTHPTAYENFDAIWTYYNSSHWSSWRNRIPENFPWDGEIRPEFDYAGADSAVAVQTETERHTEFQGGDIINWTAGAKPFGSLEEDVTPNLYGLVLPAYRDVRLIPVDTTRGGGAQLRPGWLHFITHILPVYIDHGPSTLPSGNWYARQLLTWEEEAFRDSGVDWLLANSNRCNVSGGGSGGGRGGTFHGH